MKPNNLTIIAVKLYIFLFVLLLGGCSRLGEANKIKALAPVLESINSEINNIPQNRKKGNLIASLKQEAIPQNTVTLIHELEVQFELCEISFYPEGIIAYQFKCKNDSYDNFVDSDEKYYMVKILDTSQVNKFLAYEQFLDFRVILQKLEGDWYFIQKEITFD